ncbi:MAG: hypothetical protein ACJAY8_000322 [Sphingobacteriales bacterium]|jgi:hypothetical protein
MWVFYKPKFQNMKKSARLFSVLLCLPFLFLNCAPEASNQEQETGTEKTREKNVSNPVLDGCYAAKITGDLIDKSGVQDKMEEFAVDLLKAMASMITFKVCFKDNGYARFDGSFGPFSSSESEHDSIPYRLINGNMLVFDKSDNVDIDSIPFQFTDFGFVITADSLEIEMHKE